MQTVIKNLVYNKQYANVSTRVKGSDRPTHTIIAAVESHFIEYKPDNFKGVFYLMTRVSRQRAHHQTSLALLGLKG